MEDLIIERTADSPGIEFMFSKGELKLSGKSTPENPIAFYGPVMEALEQYALDPMDATTMSFGLEYFNTSTSKYILDIFWQLRDIQSETKKVMINWYYEEDDEDILEIGEDYSSIVNIPFNIIMIETS